MRFVEHEDELRLVEVANLGQVLEQLGQQPQQKARKQARLENQLIGGEHVDDAAAAEIGAEQIGQLERGLAEQRFAPFALEREQAALDRRDRLRADEAVFRRNVFSVVGDEGEQRAEIVEVEQQQAAVVGQRERDFERAELRVAELENPAEQRRAELADRRANRMTGLAVQVPEHDGVRFRRVALRRQSRARAA